MFTCEGLCGCAGLNSFVFLSTDFIWNELTFFKNFINLLAAYDITEREFPLPGIFHLTGVINWQKFWWLNDTFLHDKMYT